MRLGFVTVMSLWVACCCAAGQSDPKGIDFFEKKIRPVLVEHCYTCHSAEAKKAKGGLSVDTRAGLLEGGDSGPAVVPGEPAKSVLLKAIRHDGPKMPSEQKKLPDVVIADFEAWVKMGAPDPRDGKAVVRKGIDYEEGRKLWAYQPVRAPAPPEGQGRLLAAGRPRPVCPRAHRGKQPEAHPRHGATHVGPPNVVRHHRAAADARRS